MNASLLHITFVVAASLLFAGCNTSSNVGPSSTNNKLGSNNSSSGAALQFSAIDYNAIKDEKLRECVRGTGAEDTSVQMLNCPYKGIYSLAGIEQFKDLRMLNVSNNNLTDLSELKELDRLSTVNLSFNSIYSLSALAEHKRMRKITANNNQIDSLADIEELPNLKRLYVNSNNISDLSRLNVFKSLEHLTAENNRAAIPYSLPDTLKTYRL